ncbi:MAG: NADP-specific glutamate dehydrogenase [Candidatus Marinimicrobia bacterium]|nr:NADP-specific glutamate dehydrogenase [Candidatus Neomarinimicrobiota bacterium]
MYRSKDEFLDQVIAKNPAEHEFHQAVNEFIHSIWDFIEENPHYLYNNILDRIVEPERVLMFRVPWVDDLGETHVNRGYRVEFNSAIGPYKGGLRFHASVQLGTLKFLGFEQIFKNSLTTLPMGGGKGGSDFSPKGKSDNEIMRFCQSFMTELYRHVGYLTDIPAGDIGVGGREIGFLFGQYKRIANEFTGMLTGKSLNWGGSLIRPEATGYGVVYFAENVMMNVGDSLKSKKVAVSGFGQVAWGVIKKCNTLGAKVITVSGPDGYVLDEDGISGEKVDYLIQLRNSNQDIVKPYAEKFNKPYFENEKPWNVKCDIAIPCATQNELNEMDAQKLVDNGVLCVTEGANMPCTIDAVEVLQKNKIMFAPGKAANAGGVAVSGLEISQNNMMIKWDAAEVDSRLRTIMENIHSQCKKYGDSGDYVDYNKGANIAGFIKVADAMIDQGIV